jgi:CrcB protein
MKTYMALVFGATIGSSIRYLLYIFNFSAFGLPLSTIIVNILGSSLAGYYYGKFENTAYIFIYLGIFGSLTTLSAFNLELFELLNNKYLFKAIIYFFLNIFLTFVFFYLFHIISIKLAN